MTKLLRISARAHDLLRQLAESERRTMGAQLEVILDEVVRRRGRARRNGDGEERR